MAGIPHTVLGLGVFSHYMAAYHMPGVSWIDRETEKIIKEEQEKRT